MSKGIEWKMLPYLLGTSRRVLLSGPPGTGKTYAAVKMNTNGKKVYQITVTPETAAAELRGHYMPDANGGFKFHYGPAIMAWKEGARLVINEIKDASGDCLTFLHAICDDPEIAGLTLPNGEFVSPRDGFEVVATMNGSVMELPVALRDRFPVHIEITTPSPDALKLLPEELRTAAEETTALDDEERRVSVRAWLEFSRLLDRVPIDIAAFAVFGKRGKDVIDGIKFSRAEKREAKRREIKPSAEKGGD